MYGVGAARDSFIGGPWCCLKQLDHFTRLVASTGFYNCLLLLPLIAAGWLAITKRYSPPSSISCIHYIHLMCLSQQFLTLVWTVSVTDINACKQLNIYAAALHLHPKSAYIRTTHFCSVITIWQRVADLLMIFRIFPAVFFQGNCTDTGLISKR